MSQTVLDVFRSALGESVQVLLAADVRLRDECAGESLHEARTALRRMRADVRVFAPYLDVAWATMLAGELRRLDRVLGAARDADVLVERLEAQLSGCASSAAQRLHDVYVARRAHAQKQVRATLAEPRYTVLLLRLVVAAYQSPGADEGEGEDAERALAHLVRRRWKRARRLVRHLGAAPGDAELHALRIRAKDLRYAAAAFLPIVGRPARRFVARVRRLQDILGEQHDAAVASERLHTYADDPVLGALAGKLAARERALAHRHARHWHRAWRRVVPERSWFRRR